MREIFSALRIPSPVSAAGAVANVAVIRATALSRNDDAGALPSGSVNLSNELAAVM